MAGVKRQILRGQEKNFMREAKKNVRNLIDHDFTVFSAVMKQLPLRARILLAIRIVLKKEVNVMKLINKKQKEG